MLQFKAFESTHSSANTNKKLNELKPARDAHSCHITNIEPLAP